MKDLKAEFEQIYSLSIRRGEDSATVWNWISETFPKQLHKLSVGGGLPNGEHHCRYSKAMNEPRPRKCVICGKPEQ